MTAAPTPSPRAAAPRRPRLDAVLALRYRLEHGGLRVRCDLPFVLQDDRLDIPFELWRGWRRLRVHAVPDADVPRTVLLAADLHGNPLVDDRGNPVRGHGHLDLDLLPARTGAAFTLVFTGPGNLITIRVALRLADEIDALFATLDADLSLPPPRVREIPRSWPLAPAARAAAD